MVRDLILIPADAVPEHGLKRRRSGIYVDAIKKFAQDSIDIVFISAVDDRDAKNLHVGLTRAIDRIEYLDQFDFTIQVTRRSDPSRVYLSKDWKDEG